MLSKGWINEFCFEKSELLKTQNISNYKQIHISNIYSDFTQYLIQKDWSFKLRLGNTEFKYLENLLLATISRNLWDNDTYYKILSKEDDYIQKAINNFKD